MAELSDAELTTVENALVSTRQALDADTSEEAMKIKAALLEAEQIVSGALDGGANQTTPAGAPTENLSMA